MHVIFEAVKEGVPVLPLGLLQLLPRQKPSHNLRQDAEHALPHGVRVSVQMCRQLGNVGLHHVWHALGKVDEEKGVRLCPATVPGQSTLEISLAREVTRDVQL